MAVHSDLKKMFPKYMMDSYDKSVKIQESGAQAKVKEVIWCNSHFQYIDSAITKDMTSFFQSAGSPGIFHLDCDGIIIFEEDGKKYIFFSELKSNFDSSDIYKAKDQIISSYLKINMIMHLLPCYNKSDYIIKAFIICLPPDKDFLRDLRQQLMLSRGNRFKTEAEFTDELCNSKEKTTILRPTDCEKLKGLPLGNNGIFNHLEFHFIEVPTGQSGITLDVHDYI